MGEVWGGGGVAKIPLEASNGLLCRHWSESWRMKCELLFVSMGREVGLSETISFVLLGFCKVLRWPPWRKLHSKIIISDLVGFFFFRWVLWWKSEVKFRTGTWSNTNRRPKMAKRSRVTTTRPVLLHWCQASIIRGCGMVLNSNRA